jgi:hypothetical protein
VNFSRFRLGIGLAVLLGLATATAGLAQNAPGTLGSPSPAVTLAPTPAATLAPSPTVTLVPVASPTPSSGPRRGRRAPRPAASGASPSPAPSDTPEPPQFTTLDGIWEVELQPLGMKLATYTHMNITTSGANISGYYQVAKKNIRYPMTGTFDGRLISMTVSMPDGTSATFSGYVESFGDMVGLYRANDKDPGTAFTAEHRKKLKS